MTPLAAKRLSPALDRLGVVLRTEDEDDHDRIAAIFASTRDDIRLAPWPEAVRAAVLAEQFRLQNAHHGANHSTADRMMVLREGEPIGRLVVDRSRAPWRLVEIAIDPLHRGGGVGTTLIRWLQREGRRDGIDLHVGRQNPRAAALYARLGFENDDGGCATHVRMRWFRP